jgi:hypothetical protein
MRTAAVTFIALALAAGTADAQGRGRNRANSQGIPPGHMPPAGQCRVWYEGVPPGRQPSPTNCDQAERQASRDRNARVIYGDDRYRDDERYGTGRVDDRNGRVYEDDRYEDRTGNRRGNGPLDVIRDRIRNRYPNGNYPTGSSATYNTAFDSGYRDGLEKGREDRGDNDSFDPVRHSWYRSGDRGYNSRYGSRDQYKLAYRDGFEAGYEQGYGRRVRR